MFKNPNLSFKFNNRELNSILIDRIEKTYISFAVEQDGTINFFEQDEELVEDILSDFRSHIFPKWQILSCPSKNFWQYRDYMEQHNIPYEEEVVDGEVGFLLPRKYNPHNWVFGKRQSLMKKFIGLICPF